MSHLIVSISKDGWINGLYKISSQGAGNTPSTIHVLTRLDTYCLISNYEVVQRNTTFLRVMGSIGRIVKDDCLNPHTNPSTSISMCHIYQQRSKHKNASSDDKCGIEIYMQTPNMRESVSKGCAIMTSSLTSSMTKSLQKEY